MKVIHIVPKINEGGGIGNIFSEVRALQKFQVEMDVTIVSLESTLSPRRMLDARTLGIRLIVAPQKDTLRMLLANTDLVVISYWNHPILTRFLIWWREQHFQIPLVLSVKVNGLTLPQVLPAWVVQIVSGILHAHPDTLIEQEEEWLPGVRMETPPFIDLPVTVTRAVRDVAEDFVAFYAGSLNRFKRLPALFDLHDKSDLPHGSIEYWGAGEDPSTIDRLSKLKFGVFRGFSESVYTDFRNNHLLLNPQSPLSYGSYEKIRVECAWMGIPCLVLKESHIARQVENGVDGIIASDEVEYIEILRWIARDVKVWRVLSDSTFSHIRDSYNIEEITVSIINFYQKICETGPRINSDISLPMTPLSRAISGMGKWAERLEAEAEGLSIPEIEYALHCEGGLIHYANMEGADTSLMKLIAHLFTLLEKR